MTPTQVLRELKSLGSAQTRKTYGRHGVSGEMYGVKYGDLSKLVRKIKIDHDLALELWESGNHDARVLATMIADPEKLTGKTLATWIKAVDNHVLSYALAEIAGHSPAGRKLMPGWMASKREWPAATGWMMVASAARMPGVLTASDARKMLATIRKEIHGRPNRVKYSMNTAMIALGAYVPGLEAEAVRVAERIGQVEVDHGRTDCQTPLAAPYIRKAAAAHRAKMATAAKKKAAKPRPSTTKTRRA